MPSSSKVVSEKSARPLKNPTYERRRQEGLCIACGKRPPAEGKTRCPACMSTHNKGTKKRFHARVRAGKCGCGATRSKRFTTCKRCREKNKRNMKKAGPKYRRRVKLAAFEAYGGAKCRCCGLEEITVLNLDHINGGGCQHEKELGSLGTNLYTHVRSLEYPPGYQVLCSNCNIGKHHNDGVCPIHGNKLI